LLPILRKFTSLSKRSRGKNIDSETTKKEKKIIQVEYRISWKKRGRHFFPIETVFKYLLSALGFRIALPKKWFSNTQILI